MKSSRSLRGPAPHSKAITLHSLPTHHWPRAGSEVGAEVPLQDPKRRASKRFALRRNGLRFLLTHWSGRDPGPLHGGHAQFGSSPGFTGIHRDAEHRCRLRPIETLSYCPWESRPWTLLTPVNPLKPNDQTVRLSRHRVPMPCGFVELFRTS